MVERFTLTLLGFYLGFSTFFSFVVAPTLFGTLEKSLAGEVVSKIFPLYFGSATTLLGLSSILLLKEGRRKLSFLLLVGTLIAAFQEFYILPLSEELKTTDYDRFLFWHGVSMFLNLVDILIALLTVGILLFRKREGKES